MVIVKTKTVSLAVLLCFYAIFVLSINSSIDEFSGMSLEVTDQSDEGVFSSLSRNFEQTIEEINTGDEKGDSSNNADEKSTSSEVPIATPGSSNLISSNSTTNDDLEKKNQTDISN
ncbi:MAG: hypothetical protein L0H53_03575 [Candidatus Nitrosocosmicus sp.]|nr:hypothetical protein [Candidatus Nitrosocosmicus sp.]MDN5866560.1 hypothetical protein [Candidatus Nitrosocosmicus sp.]